MGAEAVCRVRFNGQVANGRARLEADRLEFRGGDLRLSVPFKIIARASAESGTLSVTFPEGTAALELGPAAAKWAEKIRHPPTRLQKLGVKPAWRVSAIGTLDPTFLTELESAVHQLSRSRALKESDAIFLAADRTSDLDRLAILKASLKQDGALWVVRPKGHPEISEKAVMAAGKAAGLVDVKVVALTPTHTAEKFVIPVAMRR